MKQGSLSAVLDNGIHLSYSVYGPTGEYTGAICYIHATENSVTVNSQSGDVLSEAGPGDDFLHIQSVPGVPGVKTQVKHEFTHIHTESLGHDMCSWLFLCVIAAFQPVQQPEPVCS